MHDNSLAAYATINLSKREAEVIAALDALGKPSTDRQIARQMGSEDPSSRPRITSLISRGILRQVGDEKENGRWVRLVEVAK